MTHVSGTRAVGTRCTSGLPDHSLGGCTLTDGGPIAGVAITNYGGLE